jgi:hypothetical protein
MNFLADEDIERSVIVRLRQEGHQIQSITEVNSGLSDEAVLDLVTQEADLLLLAADKAFAELSVRQDRLGAGVVLLRLIGFPRTERPAVVAQAIAAHDGELIGAFTTITLGRVRIHRLRR